MNASALLKSQGWRGHGHTLHASDDSTGLARPLFVSRKDNKLGVGKKEHATSDQWWLNAFDQQLKGLDTSKQGVVVQTMTHGHLNALVGGSGKYQGAAGLYASFVKGGLLKGTVTEGDSTDAAPEVEDRGEAGEATKTETKEERRARRRAKMLRRAEKLERTAKALEKMARRDQKEGKTRKRKDKEGRNG